MQQTLLTAKKWVQPKLEVPKDIERELLETKDWESPTFTDIFYNENNDLTLSEMQINLFPRKSTNKKGKLVFTLIRQTFIKKLNETLIDEIQAKDISELEQMLENHKEEILCLKERFEKEKVVLRKRKAILNKKGDMKNDD